MDRPSAVTIHGCTKTLNGRGMHQLQWSTWHLMTSSFFEWCFAGGRGGEDAWRWWRRFAAAELTLSSVLRRRLLLHTHARPTEWRVRTYSNRLQQPQHGDYRSAFTTNLRPRCSSLRPTFSRTLTTINGRLKPCFYIDHPCTGHLRIVRKSFLRATP